MKLNLNNILKISRDMFAIKEVIFNENEIKLLDCVKFGLSSLGFNHHSQRSYINIELVKHSEVNNKIVVLLNS
jgi:hypothetical protein